MESSLTSLFFASIVKVSRCSATRTTGGLLLISLMHNLFCRLQPERKDRDIATQRGPTRETLQRPKTRVSIPCRLFAVVVSRPSMRSWRLAVIGVGSTIGTAFDPLCFGSPAYNREGAHLLSRHLLRPVSHCRGSLSRAGFGSAAIAC